MTRTVAGLFDSHRTADLVVEHLVQEYGVSRERVRVLALDAAVVLDDDPVALLGREALHGVAVQSFDSHLVCNPR